jgi:hypothetical protein
VSKEKGSVTNASYLCFYCSSPTPLSGPLYPDPFIRPLYPLSDVARVSGAACRRGCFESARRSAPARLFFACPKKSRQKKGHPRLGRRCAPTPLAPCPKTGAAELSRAIPGPRNARASDSPRANPFSACVARLRLKGIQVLRSCSVLQQSDHHSDQAPGHSPSPVWRSRASQAQTD